MGALSSSQLSAAEQFADATLDELEAAGLVEPEIAVVAVARMSGSYLLRSFGFELAALRPGAALLSDEANEQGPRLLRILAGILTHAGVGLDREVLGRGPDPEAPPKVDYLASQALLEEPFEAIRQRWKLSPVAAADAAAAATGFVVQQLAADLDPSVAFGLAVYGFIEGAKTVPAPRAGA